MSSSNHWYRRVFNFYIHLLEKYPLPTKTTAAAVIFFTSDSTIQCLSFRSKLTSHPTKFGENDDMLMTDVFHWDSTRAMSSACFGVVGTAWIHFWWGILENLVGSRIPIQQYKIANTLTKVIVDQTCSAPLYTYTYFTITNYLLNRSITLRNLSSQQQTSGDSSPRSRMDDLNSATEKASNMLFPTMLQHWKLWPAVHCINFYFVPLQHRVIVQNLVLVGWSGYLSYTNHNTVETNSDTSKPLDTTIDICKSNSNNQYIKETTSLANTQPP
jgi:Mpv17 / PMP22 family